MAFLRKRGETYYLIDKSGGNYKSIPLSKVIKGKFGYQEARQILAKYNAKEKDERLLSLGVTSSHVTFSELAKEYFQSAVNFKKPTTLKYEKTKINLLTKSIGSKPFSKITTDQWNKIVDGRSPNYRRLLIAAISSIYKFAISKAYITKEQDLSKMLRRPRIEVVPPKAKSPEVIQKALDELPGAWRDKYTILYYTGLRPSELVRLKVVDIDFKGRIITVRKSKTGRFRHIPMHDFIIPILQKLCGNMGQDEYLFQGEDGGHLKTLRLPEGKLRKIFRKYGISNYTFRHQFATELLNQPIPPGMSPDQFLVSLKEILGHSTIQMTLRYARVTNQTVRSVMDSFKKDPA